MTGNQYQRLAARTINNDLTGAEKELHALHGMVGEVGEIHSIYQKAFQGHTREGAILHLKKELGDLLWFVAEYCTVMEWEFDEIMQLNIDKLKARFPDGFEAIRSIERKDGDI